MSTAGKFTLSNTYKNINPDIVLIKSHGLQTNEHTKIHGHATHTVNSSEEMHDGSISSSCKTQPEIQKRT